MTLESIKKWFLFLCVALLCYVSVALAYVKKTKEKPMYTLSVYDGKIAVYENEMKYPKEIFDTNIFALPEADAARLYSGISAYTEEELQSLIEDYCS